MSRSVRRYVLAAVLVGLLAVTALVLQDVIVTAFFAITVAYVVYPLHQRLQRRGLSRRLAAGAISAGAFGIVLSALGLAGLALYRRRTAIVALVTDLPDDFSVTFAGQMYRVETSTLVDPVVIGLQRIAVNVAQSTPVLVLKLVLFGVLLFGLLLRPEAAAKAVFNVVPEGYHDVVRRFHGRTRDTLYGIYVLQAATAAATFVVAFGTFVALGYPAPVTLAVGAAVLQFVPVAGPGILLAALALADFLAGNVTRALLVALVGGIVVGLLPDAIIRPRLASYAADLPVTLYFVGFVGGILSLGAIGFIAGPLAVALVVEAVSLLSDGHQVTP